MKIFALTLASFLAATATAQVATVSKPQPKPGDFAMQIPLQVSGQNGVVRFTLPLAVYQNARSSDLADVRMFSTSGNAVPFTFIDSTASATTEWRETTARIFPLRAEPVADQANLELDVRASQDGTVLSVHANRRGGNAPVDLQALVLDLGIVPDAEVLESLQFFLPSSTTTYRAELAVERSADLKLWDRVAQSRVDWLQAAPRPGESETQLINDRIPLAQRSGRYLRIRWIDGTPLQFARIVARWRASRAATDTALQVDLKGQSGRFPGDWVYAASPALSASEIGLDLPIVNTVVPASIGYYRQQPPPKREWSFIPVTYSTFYRLTQNGSERTSSRVHIYPLALREWVVRTESPLESAPTLVLRFTPRTVVFTAQGDAKNFVLAFGASHEQLQQWRTSHAPLSQIAPAFTAQELEHLEMATLGALEPSRPADESQATASTSKKNPFNNRTFVLWGVLIAGTLLLAGMSWRLFKQMQSSPPK